MVQLVRAQGSRIARELAEAADVGAVIYHIVRGLVLWSVWKGLDDVLKGAVEGFYEVEGLVEDAVCQLAVVCSDLV